LGTNCHKFSCEILNTFANAKFHAKLLATECTYEMLRIKMGHEYGKILQIEYRITDLSDEYEYE